MWSRVRAVEVVLIVSLLANVFLIGVLAGDRLVPGGRGAQRGGLAPAERVRRLAPEERARFAAAMAPFRPDLRAARQRVRAARAEVVSQIAAPVLDPMRLDADLAALREAVQAQQSAQHKGLAAALRVLSPASRAALVAHADGAATSPPPPRVGKRGADRSDFHAIVE